MDAGAAEPLARPEEGESKPKSQETQDDGYETSNSGDALRRKHSSPESSPPPAAALAPPMAPMAPPQAATPPVEEDRYDALDLHRAAAPEAPYYHRQLPPFPQTHQPPPAFPIKRDYEEHEPYYRRDDYFKPNFPQTAPEVYAAFAAAKRDQHEAPYDMSQQPYLKRELEDYGAVKRECEDPYSFVEEDAMCAMLGAPPHHAPHHQPHHAPHQPHHPHMMHPHHHGGPVMVGGQPKKRGRKKKVKDENGMEIKVEGGMEGMDGMAPPRPVKERKKHDRFNGMSEEEVSRRTLPDHLAENLDIIIIGINPGLFAAYKGHHYAGPGNHFWKCLYLSGLTREQMSADEDYKLLNFGIGFTNMVSRATKGSADLTRREIKEGGAVLLEKLQAFRPKVAVFNGKLIYEVFSGKKDFCFGKQPDTVAGTNTYMWVMPSSSARCAQLPRAADKVPFYAALKKFRDYLNGLVAHVDEAELVFPDTTGRRPQEELEIRRLTMEPEPGDTIILEDGTEVPLKKKRGRPKKIKLENGEVVPPTPRAPRQPRAPQPSLDPNGEQPPKKKRGRPKKIRPEEQQFLLQQQQQQQQQSQQQQQQQQQQQLMTPQMPMQTINAQQQSVETQYTMHQGNDFQSQNLSEQMGQNSMLYQNTMPAQPVMGQGQSNPTYFQGAQGQAGAGPAAEAGSLVAGYAQSPGPYAHSPRPQNLAYVASPRPQAYAHSPQRHRSPAPTASPAPFPQRSPALAGSYTPSPSHTPYSQHSSPAARTPGPQYAHRADYAADLSGDISAAISSPGPVSPGIGHIDFEPPIAASKIRVGEGSREHSPDLHAGSNSGDSSLSAAGPGAAADLYHLAAATDSPTDKHDHYHYSQEGDVAGSPRLDQLHHAHMYPSPYNRSTPPGVGSPYSPHYRAPDHPPHTPHTPHTPGSPGEFQSAPKTKSQDVASKSLSGLESLVDQIPSIAEGGGGGGGGGAGGGAVGGGEQTPTAPPAPLPEPYPALYPYGYNSYPNNSYAPPFVGYNVGQAVGGGWGGQLMRPTPGYLGEAWAGGQYAQYGAAAYPPPHNYAPYYNGYAAPAPHQQYHHLPHLALELHKGADPSPAPPPVGFGGFC